MNRKSLKKNMLLNTLQKVLSIVFPLITFPYISRVLNVDDVGKINFTASVVSYFVLLSGLGIANYATREGARIREEREKLTLYCSELFSINLLATVIAYVGLIILILLSNKISSYGILIIIQSFTVIGNTLGVFWIYAIEEEYSYITIRTIIVQLISVLLMFGLVRTEQDYLIYAMITVFANVGANIFSFIHSRKYVQLKLVFNKNLLFHLRPILVIFATTIAITIYVESDTTLLGLMQDDYSVGVYSRAAKIYTIIKQLASAVVMVALPNLSSIDLKNDFQIYTNKVNSLFKTSLLIILPLGIGLLLTSGEIILLVAGRSYIDAITPLQILGFASIFANFSSYMTYCILLPLKLERVQLFATIFAAVINVILNLIVIPVYSQDGAAFTTLVAEASVLIIEILYLLLIYKVQLNFFKLSKLEILSLILGVFWVFIVCLVTTSFTSDVLVGFLLKLAISTVGYFVIQYMFNFRGLLAK
ncbi:flippase [Streptococcus suis]|nr:flippase [Streptococcus suis]